MYIPHAGINGKKHPTKKLKKNLKHVIGDHLTKLQYFQTGLFLNMAFSRDCT